MSELDKCMLCGGLLECYEYGHAVENGERAESERLLYYEMDICQSCIKNIKILIEDVKGD